MEKSQSTANQEKNNAKTKFPTVIFVHIHKGARQMEKKLDNGLIMYRVDRVGA
jgi:hypothetical protein